MAGDHVAELGPRRRDVGGRVVEGGLRQDRVHEHVLALGLRLRRAALRLPVSTSSGTPRGSSPAMWAASAQSRRELGLLDTWPAREAQSTPSASSHSKSSGLRASHSLNAGEKSSVSHASLTPSRPAPSRRRRAHGLSGTLRCRRLAGAEVGGEADRLRDAQDGGGPLDRVGRVVGAVGVGEMAERSGLAAGQRARGRGADPEVALAEQPALRGELRSVGEREPVRLRELPQPRAVRIGGAHARIIPDRRPAGDARNLRRSGRFRARHRPGRPGGPDILALRRRRETGGSNPAAESSRS